MLVPPLKVAVRGGRVGNSAVGIDVDDAPAENWKMQIGNWKMQSKWDSDGSGSVGSTSRAR
jgi:hypothetical protein